MASYGFAAVSVDLYNAPLSSLKQFSKPNSGSRAVSTTATSALQQISSTSATDKTVVRYQQTYKGIPIVGSQVIVTTNKTQIRKAMGTEQVSGHITNQVQINTQPKINNQQALSIAKKNYSTISTSATGSPQAILQIRPGTNDQLFLAYLVSFKSLDKKGHPSWPFYVINAHNGDIVQQWDNIQRIADSGPGGNAKTTQYWYGKDGLPALEVVRQGSICTMDSPAVKLIHLNKKWDWYNALVTPYKYTCGKNVGDPINGAYAPANDAFYFGFVIANMYKNWYGLSVLRGTRSQVGQLLMRVHFGVLYDNAFWDGTAMSFGDGGGQFYPLVSLDVAGHEVTHGFTQQHSGLEYHDQPGALNESMSDMGGQAARAYLLSTSEALYKKAYLGQSAVTWGIGETIIRPGYGTALRYMNEPSLDNSSADCDNKALAQRSGETCVISYAELVAFAKTNFAKEQDRQNYIVHTASGVFNKAFYLLSQQIGIRTAYKIMIQANVKYWTPTTNFASGACGILHATQDLGLNTNPVRVVFNKVGVSTTSCKL